MNPPPTSKKGLEVGIVYNRSNGLEKDAKLLEEYMIRAAKEKNTIIGKFKHFDPREVPVMCDIIIHLEIPYYAWFPYARYTILMVNPEWWVSEAYDPYLSQIDLLLFKNESTMDTFKITCNLGAEKLALVPWCCLTGAPITRPVKEFLYLIGGSMNKANAAKDVVTLWKDSYPPLHIYTSSDDFDFGESKENVYITRKELTSTEVAVLQRKYVGHCVASEAEGFGFTAAEAESAGAFCLMNHNEAYDEAYNEDTYVCFLPTTQLSNDKTRSSRYCINVSESEVILDAAMADFAALNTTQCITTRNKASQTRRNRFKNAVAAVFERALQGVESNLLVNPKLMVPPGLTKEECPFISIVTLIYNRRKFWDLALHNMMITDYPRDKMEWVIVDDSDDMTQSISDKITKIQAVLSGLDVVYVPFTDKRSIGAKRNAGVKRAKHNILLMMDDDDHYPETSFRRRVAYLEKNPEKTCAVCTTIALYDLRTGVSAVNVPPYDLPLGKRISEATLTFRRSFFEARKFEKISMAEGDAFITGRESQVVEMMPQHIIVSFCHGSNSSSRRIPPSDVKPACFWGFPAEFLQFIHKLAGIEVELTDSSPS